MPDEPHLSNENVVDDYERRMRRRRKLRLGIMLILFGVCGTLGGLLALAGPIFEHQTHPSQSPHGGRGSGAVLCMFFGGLFLIISGIVVLVRGERAPKTLEEIAEDYEDP